MRIKFIVVITSVLIALFAFSTQGGTLLASWAWTHQTISEPWRSDPVGHGRFSPSAPTTPDDAGMVLIDTEVDFGSAQAAGTGLVIDSDGIVVTNHHVVAGSTAVTVTDPATGETYTADVLGYDATIDVAVLQLDGAVGLATITADTNPASVGQSVTAVGNAGGKGQLVSSTGQVTATGQDITVTEDDGTNADLTDLIAVSAAMVPGDSGGALLDTDNEVVGMNVAGSTTTQVSYAIPISSVLQVADTVLSGTATDTVALGRTGAIGVQVSSQVQGVYVVGVIDSGPADQAGITPGSVIASIDGHNVESSSDLSSILSSHQAGDQVSVAWTDSSGGSHTAIVTLTQSPLD